MASNNEHGNSSGQVQLQSAPSSKSFQGILEDAFTSSLSDAGGNGSNVLLAGIHMTPETANALAQAAHAYGDATKVAAEQATQKAEHERHRDVAIAKERTAQDKEKTLRSLEKTKQDQEITKQRRTLGYIQGASVISASAIATTGHMSWPLAVIFAAIFGYDLLREGGRGLFKLIAQAKEAKALSHAQSSETLGAGADQDD